MTSHESDQATGNCDMFNCSFSRYCLLLVIVMYYSATDVCSSQTLLFYNCSLEAQIARLSDVKAVYCSRLSDDFVQLEKLHCCLVMDKNNCELKPDNLDFLYSNIYCFVI